MSTKILKYHIMLHGLIVKSSNMYVENYELISCVKYSISSPYNLTAIIKLAKERVNFWNYQKMNCFNKNIPNISIRLTCAWGLDNGSDNISAMYV